MNDIFLYTANRNTADRTRAGVRQRGDTTGYEGEIAKKKTLRHTYISPYTEFDPVPPEPPEPPSAALAIPEPPPKPLAILLSAAKSRLSKSFPTGSGLKDS